MSPIRWYLSFHFSLLTIVLLSIQNPCLMLLQPLLFSSLLSSQYLRWDIFLPYGKQIGLQIVGKVGRQWGVSFQFYIAVSVSTVLELWVYVTSSLTYFCKSCFSFIPLHQLIVGILSLLGMMHTWILYIHSYPTLGS